MNLKRARRSAVAIVILVGLGALPSPVRAEPTVNPPQPLRSTTPTSALLVDQAVQRAIDAELRRSEQALVFQTPPQRSQTTGGERRRGVGRIILGAATGAVAGFFAGAYLGAYLEPDCNCDDPGLKGVLIGAPLGAVAGGIVGGKWFF